MNQCSLAALLVAMVSGGCTGQQHSVTTPSAVAEADDAQSHSSAGSQQEQGEAESVFFSTRPQAHPEGVRGRVPGKMGERLDGRLAQAAQLLVKIDADGASRNSSVLYHALQAVGVPEARAIGCSAFGPTRDAAISRIVQCLQENDRAECNRYGIASQNDARGAVAVGVCVGRFVELSPLPAFLPRRATLAFDAKLSAPYESASLVVTSPAGRIVKPEMEQRGQSVSAQLDLDEKGTWQVELLGNGPRGPDSLLNFPIRVAVTAPPLSPEPAAELESKDEAVLESRLVDRINDARRHARLPKLESSLALAEVAREYSGEMRQTGIVAHISPHSGNASQRVARAGLKLRGVAENLALASSAEEAHVGLMASPGHRANILHPLARRVGVGVALTSDEPPMVYVTQLFELAEDTAKLEVSAKDLLEQIGGWRMARGMEALRNDSALEKAANAAARGCPSPQPRYGEDLKKRFAKLSLLALVTNAPEEQLASVPELVQPGKMSVGIAVRRVEKDGQEALCVVVMLGSNQ